MNATVIVERNDLNDGGSLELLLGLQPHSDSPFSDTSHSAITYYRVKLGQNSQILEIQGIEGSLIEEVLRYIIALVQQLAPHISAD